MGHELSHAFDDQGREYDETGNGDMVSGMLDVNYTVSINDDDQLEMNMVGQVQEKGSTYDINQLATCERR